MSPIVMLHGWGTGAAVFHALRAQPDGFRNAQAPDLPGYGTSAPCGTFTLKALAERVSTGAPPRCCVIGWSLGAQVALAWARAQPEQVEALVIIAATPCFVQRDDWRCAMDVAVFEHFCRALETDAAATLARFAALQAHGEDDARTTSRRLRAALAESPLPDSSVLVEGLRLLREADLRTALSAVAQPVLLVHGERDQLVPVTAARYMASALPHGRLEVIPGAAHAPFVSAQGRVRALVQEFFGER